MSPFEMDVGYSPESPLDVMPGVEIPIESVEAVKKRLKSSLAQYSYKVLKARQRAQPSMPLELQSTK